MNLINTPLWYVTKPTTSSTLTDICFEAKLPQLKQQFDGGLKPADIVGMFKSRQLAELYALELLRRQ